MKHTRLLYGKASQAPHYIPAEATAARQSWFDLLEEMKAAQVHLFNYGLAPVTETPEHLEGYFLLDCKNLEEAIGWAAKISYAQGARLRSARQLPGRRKGRSREREGWGEGLQAQRACQ